LIDELKNFTENKIMRWIRHNPNNFRILKGEPYQIRGSVRGRCWVVRNHEYWNQYKHNKEVIDMHFDKKLETLELDLVDQNVLGNKVKELPF